jgi:hypothetical protein
VKDKEINLKLKNFIRAIQSLMIDEEELKRKIKNFRDAILNYNK